MYEILTHYAIKQNLISQPMRFLFIIHYRLSVCQSAYSIILSSYWQYIFIHYEISYLLHIILRLVGTQMGGSEEREFNEENSEHPIFYPNWTYGFTDADIDSVWGLVMGREEDRIALFDANSTLNSLDIKGKDYIPVNERIKAFRLIYPRGLIKTEIIGLENGICTMKAEVYDDEGRLLATGHAQEKETSSFINKTSYIENCETSCVGRALGNMGIGLDYGFASYEEVANAKKQQEDAKNEKISNDQWKTLNRFYSKEEIKAMYQELGITKGQDIPQDYAVKKIEEYWQKSKKELPDKDFF